MPQHIRHSRAHQPSFPRRREPTPAPDSDPGARTLRADRAPTHPSFPRPPPVIPPQAGTHACPGLRSGGSDSQGRPCPNTSVIPTPLPPSFPRRREPTPVPDSDPGARTLRADRAPTQPSFPRPPTVIPAQAGTHGPGRPVYCPQHDPLRLHPSQRHKRHPLHRRHLRPCPTHLATQERLRQPLRPPLRHRPPSVVRNPRIHEQRHLPRESPQEMAQSLENQADRRKQHIMVRPLQQADVAHTTHRHSRAHQPSFPRRREPTPAPDSDPGARTLRADHAPTHPSFPHPSPRHSRAGRPLHNRWAEACKSPFPLRGKVRMGVKGLLPATVH